jgi:ABC-2 type transport system ATP-binding protein
MMDYCPQDNLFMNELTAAEWTKTLCILRGVPEFDCSELFSALGLNEQLKGRIGEKSGGNKRKVCLASSLIGNLPIVILDEATSGVDFTSRTRIWSLISSLKNTTVIMGTHTLEECEKIADRIRMLVDGEVSVLDPPTALRQLFKCA